MLEGFELNRDAILSQRFSVPISSTIDRATGAISLDIPSFVPMDSVNAPGGATHFKIVSAGALLDFDAQTYLSDLKESAPMVLNSTATAALTIGHAVTGGTTKPMMLVMGLQFLQQINGVLYPLRNSAYGALAIVKCQM